ncbi:amidohydrolase family protein [Candidatus Formimonas warabiya]|uniref:Amidohydrolase-related domain-containing protein n=1 Tax=Formimonas warabiya TaxID=1761012 RepID=A0A3G1KTV4_FORW1|nr:amidohydrolase family protein [Candidatus Formimonas warabiya]ATW25857.1 hypothetical protein DCMF_14740 [Candidatus Formimonas warabiya]
MAIKNTILIKNGYIVTMNGKSENFLGDILVENDRIKKIEARIVDRADQIIDASDKVIIPGLIQTHVHLCQTLFRNIANDLALMEWLDIIMPLESCHDEETAYISAKLGIAEMLKSGTTTINDMGAANFATETAYAVKDLGIRAQLGRTIMDSDWAPEYLRHDTEKGLVETEDFINKWHGQADHNITCGLPIRWILTTTDQSLKGLKDIAAKYHVPIHTHANENLSENEVIFQEKGMSTIEYFCKLGLTDHKLQMAHCIWVSEKEKQILKENNISVLHCPSCNNKAASGIAPVPEYLSGGINVSLGADTAACNDNLDLFVEMRLAALMQKPRLGPTSISADDVFKMATSEGAKALLLDKQIGSIEVGKKADIVILNRSIRNSPFNIDNVIPALVYSFNGRDVNTTVVNGRILVKDGRLVDFDEHQLMKEAEYAIKKVIAKAKKLNRYQDKR